MLQQNIIVIPFKKLHFLPEFFLSQNDQDGIGSGKNSSEEQLRFWRLMQGNSLRWFRHVERMGSDVGKRILSLELPCKL